MVGVSVTALIPGDDAEAGHRELWGDHIEGAGEVGSAVDEHQYRIVGRTPFVHRDSDTVSVDPVGALRGDGSGKRPLIGHPGEATTVAVVLDLGWSNDEAPKGGHCWGTAVSRRSIDGASRVLWAGCEESLGELPPIRTTTTTSTTTTLPDLNRYFYEVKPGDTLFAIAGYFQVPMAEIVALNGLEDADDIQVGQMLEIPSGLVIVTIPDEVRLGGATTTSSTIDPATPSVTEG